MERTVEVGKERYKKLQFELSEDAIRRLNQLKEATDASSRADVVRNSLRVYEYMITMIKEGYQLEFKKDKTRITVVPLPI